MPPSQANLYKSFIKADCDFAESRLSADLAWLPRAAALRVAASPSGLSTCSGTLKWWLPNGLFQFTARGQGQLAFELGQAVGSSSGCPMAKYSKLDEFVSGGGPRAWSSAGSGRLRAHQTGVHVRFEPTGRRARPNTSAGTPSSRARCSAGSRWRRRGNASPNGGKRSFGRIDG